MIFRAAARIRYWSPRPDARGWYVNLESAAFGERTISTRDHVLDIWCRFDTGIPRWKDEDELAASIAAGRTTPPEAAEIRAEGQCVMRKERPWPTGWEGLVPDPAWASRISSG